MRARPKKRFQDQQFNVGPPSVAGWDARHGPFALVPDFGEAEPIQHPTAGGALKGLLDIMPSPPYRILIVDDHKIFRQGLRVLLEAYSDFQVVGDTESPSALTRAIEVQPHVIVMDLQIPNIDSGIQLLAEVRETLPTVRVIVLTAYSAEPTLVYRTIRAGAAGYVSKDSTDIQIIEEAIRKVTNGQLYFSGSALTSFIEAIRHGQQTAAPASPEDSDGLSPREWDVLDLVAQGYTNRQIADRLIISESTVRSHLHHILDKLQLENRVQAATYALRTRPTSRKQDTSARADGSPYDDRGAKP